MAEIDNMSGVTIGGKNINNIRYADDTVLIADSQEKLQQLVTSLVDASERRGLTINKGKTKVMVATKRNNSPRINIIVGDKVLDQVDQFNYLGSVMTWDVRCETEIKRRINIAKNKFSNIRKLVTNTKLSIRTRRRFVKCYIWSTLMYGCETWTISRVLEERIGAMEMWLWRRILKGPVDSKSDK
jgi:ribosome-interacting GTPase 1